jgi:hypothetical protein
MLLLSLLQHWHWLLLLLLLFMPCTMRTAACTHKERQ